MMSLCLRRPSVLICIVVALFLGGCSTTGSDVRLVSTKTDLSTARGVLVAITGEQIQISLQDSSRLYKLHSSSAEVLDLARTIAIHYGFELVDVAAADYVFNVTSAVPDGGACMEGVDSAELDVSYTLSLLTLGAFPATAVHCLVVTMELYSVRDGEQDLMGEFISNAGSVEVVSGVKNLRNYRRLVDARDEKRALEVSIGTLYSEVISEDAFR